MAMTDGFGGEKKDPAAALLVAERGCKAKKPSARSCELAGMLASYVVEPNDYARGDASMKRACELDASFCKKWPTPAR